jgi:hypothetical protein
MVDFSEPEPDKQPQQSKRGGIEEYIGEEDVSEQALRIAVAQHQRQHRVKKEDHHVEVRQKDNIISEDEERVIREISRHERKDAEYKIATAESASGSYGGINAAGEAAYGSHAHSAEASCTCGWRATPEHAMNEFMRTEQDKKKKGSSAYASDADEGTGTYGTQSLEGMTHGYTPNMGGGNPGYQ